MYIQTDPELTRIIDEEASPTLGFLSKNLDFLYSELNPERKPNPKPKIEGSARETIKALIKEFSESKGIKTSLFKAVIDPVLWRVTCGSPNPVRPEIVWRNPSLTETGAERNGWGSFEVYKKQKNGEFVPTSWRSSILEKNAIERPKSLVIYKEGEYRKVRVNFSSKSTLKELKKESSKVSEGFRDHFKQILANQEQILANQTSLAEKLAILEERGN